MDSTLVPGLVVGLVIAATISGVVLFMCASRKSMRKTDSARAINHPAARSSPTDSTQDAERESAVGALLRSDADVETGSKAGSSTMMNFETLINEMRVPPGQPSVDQDDRASLSDSKPMISHALRGLLHTESEAGRRSSKSIHETQSSTSRSFDFHAHATPTQMSTPRAQMLTQDITSHDKWPFARTSRRASYHVVKDLPRSNMECPRMLSSGAVSQGGFRLSGAVDDAYVQSSNTHGGNWPVMTRAGSLMQDDMLSHSSFLMQSQAIQKTANSKWALVAVLPDLQVQKQIGHGAHGQVYQGVWREQAVAVKVIQHEVRAAGEDGARHGIAGMPSFPKAGLGPKQMPAQRLHLFEGMVGISAQHPNIVKTFRIIVQPLSGRSNNMPMHLSRGNSQALLWQTNQFPQAWSQSTSSVQAQQSWAQASNQPQIWPYSNSQPQQIWPFTSRILPNSNPGLNSGANAVVDEAHASESNAQARSHPSNIVLQAELHSIAEAEERPGGSGRIDLAGVFSGFDSFGNGNPASLDGMQRGPSAHAAAHLQASSLQEIDAGSGPGSGPGSSAAATGHFPVSISAPASPNAPTSSSLAIAAASAAAAGSSAAVAAAVAAQNVMFQIPPVRAAAESTPVTRRVDLSRFNRQDSEASTNSGHGTHESNAVVEQQVVPNFNLDAFLHNYATRPSASCSRQSSITSRYSQPVRGSMSNVLTPDSWDASVTEGMPSISHMSGGEGLPAPPMECLTFDLESSLSSGAEERLTARMDPRNWGPGPHTCRTIIVQELCLKGSLRAALNSGVFHQHLTGAGEGSERIRICHIMDTAIEVASALGYLHSKKLVHGDLKAENVLLQASETSSRGFVAKVADFGLAHMLQQSDEELIVSRIGTVSHMPPESMKDNVVVLASDIYSFGILLWELYCAAKPFASYTPFQMLTAVVADGERPQFPSHCPEPYHDLAMECMLGDYKLRPDIAAVQARLRAMAGQMEEVIDVAGSLARAEAARISKWLNMTHMSSQQSTASNASNLQHPQLSGASNLQNPLAAGPGSIALREPTFSDF